MRIPRWAAVAVGLVAVTTAVLFLSEAGYLAPRPVVKNLTIEARQFAFTPNIVQVNQGDHVHVQLISEDVTHGFYVDSYGVETMAQPGHPATVDFIANRAGTYRFRCAVTCGPLHPFMIGELTVLPASSVNPGPFVATFILAAIAAVGTVATVWPVNQQREALHG